MKNSIAILLLAACVFSGCSKILKSNPSTFTVTGTLLVDCGGRPVANAPVRADMYGDHLVNHDVYGIGNATTDANGHFSMKCSTTFAGQLVLGVNGVKYIQNYTVSNRYPDIDFKNIYGLIQQNVYIKIIGNGSSYTAKDTLFFNQDTVFPITNKVFLISSTDYGLNFIDASVIKGVNDPNSVLRNDTGYVTWGVGANDFQKAKKSGETGGITYPYYRIIKYTRLGCAGTDTAVINIP